MKRKSPREQVAAHLRAAGYNVEADDIRFIHGGRYKTLNDVLECWSVVIGECGKGSIEIQGGGTLTECARGITLKKNTPKTCLYGDLIAYPKRNP